MYSSSEEGGRTLGWVLTEDFLEQGSMSCIFQGEQDFGRWGKGCKTLRQEWGAHYTCWEKWIKASWLESKDVKPDGKGLEEALSTKFS